MPTPSASAPLFRALSIVGECDVGWVLFLDFLQNLRLTFGLDAVLEVGGNPQPPCARDLVGSRSLRGADAGPRVHLRRFFLLCLAELKPLPTTRMNKPATECCAGCGRSGHAWDQSSRMTGSSSFFEGWVTVRRGIYEPACRICPGVR